MPKIPMPTRREAGPAQAPMTRMPALSAVSEEEGIEWQKLGATLKNLGGDLGEMYLSGLRSQIRNEITDATLKYDELQSQYLLDLEKDKDYRGWLPKSSAWHDSTVAEILGGMKIEGAKKQVSKRFKNDKNNLIYQVGLKSFRISGENERASLDREIENAARTGQHDEVINHMEQMVNDGFLVEEDRNNYLQKLKERTIEIQIFNLVEFGQFDNARTIIDNMPDSDMSPERKMSLRHSIDIAEASATSEKEKKFLAGLSKAMAKANEGDFVGGQREIQNLGVDDPELAIKYLDNFYKYVKLREKGKALEQDGTFAELVDRIRRNPREVSIDEILKATSQNKISGTQSGNLFDMKYETPLFLKSKRIDLLYQRVAEDFKNGTITPLEYDKDTDAIYEFARANPDPTAEQVDSFYNELRKSKVKDWLNKWYMWAPAIRMPAITGSLAKAYLQKSYEEAKKRFAPAPKPLLKTAPEKQPYGPLKEKVLTEETARVYLTIAGGDRAKAEEMARTDGYIW